LPLAELETQVERADSELPPFWISISPILLPVLMISLSTVLGTLDELSRQSGGSGVPDKLLASAEFFGHRNAAMFTSAIVALLILFRQSRLPLAKLMKSMEPAIASAGVIILITAAGGAFGAMIRHSGVGDVIQSAIGFNASGTMILIVAFAISATMKIAQGSSTVALITASAIMYPVISGIGLPYHPVYVFLAIGFGAMVFSWMSSKTPRSPEI